MAFNPSYNNNRGSSYPKPQNRPYSQPSAPQEIKAVPLPADYVDCAEAAIKKHMEERNKITTSKIRNLLSLISDIYNTENLRNADTLLPESQTALTMARIRFIYESGRDGATKAFVLEAKLLEYLKDIGTSRQKLIDYSHYMEALVAYHRFLIGGREG